MTDQDKKQLKIDMLVRLDGLKIAPDVLHDLAKRQSAQDTVQAAMDVLIRHGLNAVKMENESEGGAYLSVLRAGEEDEWVSAMDLDGSDIKDSLDEWDAAYGSATRIPMDQLRPLMEQEMLLVDQAQWLSRAYGEDLTAPVALQIEANKRSDRGLAVSPANEENPITRSRRRP